jgi:hypothetical protein
MTNLQPAPKGFVLGEALKYVGNASWDTEWCPAWIRPTDCGADVIWIERNGDYCGLFQRVPHNQFAIIVAA